MLPRMRLPRPTTVECWNGGRRPSMIVVVVVICVVAMCSEQVAGQNNLQCSSFTNWQAYYSEWYTQYPTYAYYNMYPFGTIFCDTNATSNQKGSGLNPNINFNIPFYGSTWRSLWISPYGNVQFNDSENLQYAPMPTYVQINWPNPDYPTTGTTDPPFAAPFYADLNYRIGSSYEPSQISYRVLDTSTTTDTSQQNIMLGMLNLVSLDVRQSVVGATYFAAQKGLVITYYNVTFSGIQCQTGTNQYDTCLRNTFQMALVTDYVSTYVVYNYFNITFVGGSNYQQCDPTTGQASAAYPNCIPAQIGFNSGFARGFAPLPYSETAEVINMAKMSGTNVTGRWIYEISGDKVRHGGCTNTTALGSGPNMSWPLVSWPIFGPQFGGNVVNVSGPCFLSTMSIKCRFGQSVPVTAYNWGDMMMVMCIQPVMYEVGPVVLSVSTDGGQNYYFSTIYTVIQQEYVPQLGVEVYNANGNWLTPATIQLTWNPLNLSSEWGNQITIQLLGYANQTWQVVYTFDFQAENTGTYSFTYNNMMCFNQNNHLICSKYNLGAFRVSLSDWQWDPSNPMALWSAPVPLGWFMKDQVMWDNQWWASTGCQNWYAKDSQSTSWHNNLEACPCTLNQSYVDFGRFQPSPDCNIINTGQNGNCQRNGGAIACYQSTNITSYGSSSRCCYNKIGNLMYSGDTINGSTSQRADPSGLAPYGTSPNIPSISNWQIDLLPWYYCCVWQNNPYDCFNLYMNVRPTQDCKNYNVPGHATAWGDPHFNTMDGTLYSFNGWGEYWLLYINNAPISGGTASFYIQGRFQQPTNQTWGQIKATVMTAVAMQLNNGTIVSVESNLYNNNEHLLIYVNSTLLNFSFPGNYYQQFPDVLIINNDPVTAKLYTNFTIIFRIGFGINVAWANGVIEMFATIPPEFMRQTGGLFGYWNGDSNDDLVPRGSSGGSNNAVNPSDTESVFYSFGKTWLVMEQESLFIYLYRSQLNYNYYYNPWFVPYFTATIPPNGTVTQGQVSAVCSTDMMCQYDYMVTENESVAIDTHAITMWDTQLRQMGVYIASCGWLNIPNSVKMEPVSYTVNSQVNIQGCMAGFVEYGSTYNYMCQYTSDTTSSAAAWTTTIGVSCAYLNGQLPQSEQAAISVPVTVVSSLLIALAVLLFICNRRRRRRALKEAETKPINTGPAPANTAAGFMDTINLHEEPVPGTKQELLSQQPYGNATAIVTGSLSGDYMDRSRQSRSTTPSKMSVNSALWHVGPPVPANGKVMAEPPPGESTVDAGIRLSVASLPVPPARSHSRPGTPGRAATPAASVQTFTRTVPVTYTTDPARAVARPVAGYSVPSSGRSTPVSVISASVGGRESVAMGSAVAPPYAYPNAGNRAATPASGVDRAADYYQRRYGAPMQRSASNDSVV